MRPLQHNMVFASDFFPAFYAFDARIMWSPFSYGDQYNDPRKAGVPWVITNDIRVNDP